MTVTERHMPFVVANDALDQTQRLRDLLAENGYLFFRSLGPKDRILALRRQMLEICAQAGWVDPKADLMDAIWSGAGPFAENDPPYMEVYRRIVHLALFNELPQDPAYMDLLARIVGGPVFNHRMHIGRVSFPNNTVQTTPPHQDFQYIQGTPQTYTVWTPLGDTPIQLGGLMILSGSNRAGFLEHRLFPEQKYAGWGVPEEHFPKDARWHAGDFRTGDFLVFHSHTIHKALPNLTGNRLRLSCDNRYQLQGDQTGPAAHRTHHDL